MCLFNIKPLHIIFKNCLENECFPNEWKKANAVPAYKKGYQQLPNNYRPVSLLPIYAKVFGRIVFNSLSKFLNTSKLINKNQPRFCPGDSCVHQLLSKAHKIYKSFDANPSLELRGVFLNLSKASEKIWHEGLVYKLRCLRICRKYYGLPKPFKSDKFQRVVLNGQSSSWCHIKLGVPHGSILGSLFFWVYIDNLPEGLMSVAKLFMQIILHFFR